METLIKSLIEAGQTWPGVSVAFREDWQCEYFKVAEKGFCMLGKTATGQLVMTVKGDPQKNEELREQYSSVLPGYYANKTHWNSFLLAEKEFSERELISFLKESYQLVVNKLPKKVQTELSLN